MQTSRAAYSMYSMYRMSDVWKYARKKHHWCSLPHLQENHGTKVQLKSPTCTLSSGSSLGKLFCNRVCDSFCWGEIYLREIKSDGAIDGVDLLVVLGRNGWQPWLVRLHHTSNKSISYADSSQDLFFLDPGNHSLNTVSYKNLTLPTNRLV